MKHEEKKTETFVVLLHEITFLFGLSSVMINIFARCVKIEYVQKRERQVATNHEILVARRQTAVSKTMCLFFTEPPVFYLPW